MTLPTPSSLIYQSAINFSEGRRPEVVEAIADAIRSVPDVRLSDYSADRDHNRCVMTFLGRAQAVRTAALSAARVAVTEIDLRHHQGVHPRIGAIDVLPIVPLPNRRFREETDTPPPLSEVEAKTEAIALAHAIGQDLATTLNLPVYFYEWAAQPGRQSALPELRRGGFEAISRFPLIGERAPDLGPNAAHPSAGIAVVGARSPLIAYNVNLDTSEVAIAQAIAHGIRKLRATTSYLIGVRALGLFLASQNRAQVSLNLTRPDLTPLPDVFAFVAEEAQRRGANAYESEIIGAIPLVSLNGQAPESILWRAYRPTQLLETWLTE